MQNPFEKALIIFSPFDTQNPAQCYITLMQPIHAMAKNRSRDQTRLVVSKYEAASSKL